MEVERKFQILRGCGGLYNPAPEVEICQGYIPVPAGELRLRRKGEEYFLTVKGDGTLSREEFETRVPAWVFEQLWPATEGRRVEKTRRTIEFEGQTLEFDVYQGAHSGLLVLEIEFPDEAAAQAFRLPWWMTPGDYREVTADKRYKNRWLAENGVPTDEPKGSIYGALPLATPPGVPEPALGFGYGRPRA